MTIQTTKDTMYMRVSDQLRDAIRSGKYPSGRLPTERVLGVRHDVSLGTVRKALDVLEQEGIILRRRGSGTYIRRKLHPQPQIGSRRTHLICHLSGTGTETHIGNFFNRLMLAVQNQIEMAGYATVLAGIREGKVPMPILKQKVDGVIIAGTFLSRSTEEANGRVGVQENNAMVTKVVDAGLPVVAINNRTDCQTIHSVRPDYHDAMHQGLAYLKSMGHQHVAIYGGPRAWPSYGERIDAFFAQAQRLDMDADPQLAGLYETWAYMDPDAVVVRVRDHLKANPQVTAAIVISGTPHLVVKGIEAAGLRFPHDLSVLTFADMPRSESLQQVFIDPDIAVAPNFASLELPVHALAAKAVERLVALLDGRTFTAELREISVPLVLTPGESVVEPRTGAVR